MSAVRLVAGPGEGRVVKVIEHGDAVEQPDGGVDGDVAVELEQGRLVGGSGGFRAGHDEGMKGAHGVAHNGLVAQPIWIKPVEVVINEGERDMHVMGVHRGCKRAWRRWRRLSMNS